MRARPSGAPRPSLPLCVERHSGQPAQTDRYPARVCGSPLVSGAKALNCQRAFCVGPARACSLTRVGPGSLGDSATLRTRSRRHQRSCWRSQRLPPAASGARLPPGPRSLVFPPSPCPSCPGLEGLRVRAASESFLPYLSRLCFRARFCPCLFARAFDCH